ncbi:MAG: non-canonical purine NTP pyrophosphatase [Anaerolineales bacterium]
MKTPLKLLLATANVGKASEMRAVLSILPIELLDLNDLSIHLSVPEDGTTYQENALKKALAYLSASGLPTLADDSGLEVDALNGEPGIFSAPFYKTPTPKRLRPARIPSLPIARQATSLDGSFPLRPRPCPASTSSSFF